MGIERVPEEGFYTFDMVEARLVDAFQLWRRMPDGDARFGLSGRISSLWRQYVPDVALVDAVADEPRPLRPSRGDIARMEEATEWITRMPERNRRLALVAIAWLATARLQSDKARIEWQKLWERLGIERPGPDGLRKRYGATITAVANSLNSGRGSVKGLKDALR